MRRLFTPAEHSMTRPQLIPDAMFSVTCARDGDTVTVASVSRMHGYDTHLGSYPSGGFALALRDAHGRELTRTWLRLGFIRCVGAPREASDRPDAADAEAAVAAIQADQPLTDAMREALRPEPIRSWSQPTGSYHGDVPALPGGVELVIVDDDRVLWSRQAPSRPPEIRDVQVTVDGDALHVSWTDTIAPEVPAERYSASAQWERELPPNASFATAGGGYILHGIRRDAAGGDPVAHAGSGELYDLPPGEIGVVVRVEDGFHAVRSAPVRVRVPDRPLRVEILPFLFGPQPPAGVRMMIAGSAHLSRTERVPDADAYRWAIDGREVARGESAWIDAPAEGEHELTLTVVWRDVATTVRQALTTGAPGSDPRWKVLGAMLESPPVWER